MPSLELPTARKRKLSHLERVAWIMRWLSVLAAALLLLTLPRDARARRHSVRSEMKGQSSYIRKLDKQGLVEHPLQLIDPKKLQDSGSLRNISNKAPTLDISATTFTNGDTIVVTLHNEAGTWTSEQWIGAYSPSNANITEVVPIKVAFPFYADANYNSNGVANVSFQLVNMRANYKFYFFDCPLAFPACEIQAESAVVYVDDPNAPLKPRVLPVSGKSSTDMRLMWSSNCGPSSAMARTSENGTKEGPIVQWGLDKSELPNTVVGKSFTYAADDMCGGPAVAEGYRDIGWIHEAILTGLPAGKSIFYRFGNNNGGGEGGSKMSGIEELRVPPKRGTSGVRLFLYGDMGRGSDDDAATWREYGEPAINTTRQLRNHIDNESWGDAIFHIGDISYATGYAAVWDEWLDMVSPVAKRIPYLVNGGNHECDSPAESFPANRTPTFFEGDPDRRGGDSGGECGVPMVNLLKTPRVSAEEQWWSWDIGNVHIVAMNTEYDFRRSSEQYAWLKNDLAGVDRRVTPWIIFGGHRPMYVSFRWHKSAAALLVEHIEPLLIEHEVDLVIWGHHHSVQRFCAVSKDTCKQRSQVSSSSGSTYIYKAPKFPIHNVIGSAGADFAFSEENPYPNTLDRSPFYRWGFAQVEAINATHLWWKYIDNGSPVDGSSNVPGTVLDEFYIIKDPLAEAGDSDGGSSRPNKWLVGGFALGFFGILAIECILLHIWYKRKYGKYQRLHQSRSESVPNDADEKASEPGPEDQRLPEATEEEHAENA
eukprot:gb/GECG01002754.1/.p1 GENE.gb/GECG01002754.1/~~gb/GECG01002754.1/.p1  ORF type:complete len:765 (+),score=79.04 gb/GECG01002754.1/:1-2295(+)